jgi:hypothetical protein
VHKNFDCLFSRRLGIERPAVKRSKVQHQLPCPLLAVETFCCCDPSVDFALAPGHANAAPLAIVNTTAAAMLSNRLDIGSPPFFREPAHAVRER